MLSVATPYSLRAVSETSTGLCLTERWYLAPGLPRVDLLGRGGVLGAFVAFVDDHKRCGELDGGPRQ